MYILVVTKYGNVIMLILNNHVIQLKFFMIISGGELVCVRSRLQGARRERRLRGAGVRVRPGGRGQGRSCRHHEQLVWIASFPLKNVHFCILVANFLVASVSKNTSLTTDLVVIFAFFTVSVVI